MMGVGRQGLDLNQYLNDGCWETGSRSQSVSK